MLGPEHYCISHQGWVCSAAPIHGLNGEVAGCLNMSGAKAAVHPHTLGMAKAAAFAIEQQMLASHNKQMMHASLHRTVNILSGNNANRSFADILEASPGLRGTVAIAERFASYDGTVYLNGEVGTGKEFFAQAIHNASSRAAGPFVVVNCASLPRVSVESELFGSVETYAGEEAGEKGERGERGERGARGERGEGGYPGKLELANLGTVYLQEIAELPLEYQAELLQVLESRTVKRIGSTQARHLDVRIIASSSRNLRGEVEAGRFRNDLFVFINVLRIDLSPLRERPDDILVCAKRALEYFNQRYPENRKTMSDAFISRLVSYHWPGNTKELQNCIERSFYASNDNILYEHLLDGLAGDGLDLQSLSDAAYSNAAMQAGYYGASVQIGQPLPASQNGFVGQMGLGGLLGQPAKGSLLGQPAKFAINVSDNHEYIEIVNALRVNDFDVGKAAFAIGMSRATLYRHIAKLQINVKALRAATRSYGLRRRA
jgi:transcriptional regulator with PAS, ATPase and Fis domain